ncbi:MAG TPA: ATP-binding protein [Burkholderiaceae bacterium]
MVIAVLGAESTGKTTLARGLADSLAAQGRRVALVEEFLREFCLREGRTPRQDEQATIAQTQSQRIADAARTHELVVADTTALMIAVYSQLLFDDDSLVAAAVAQQAHHRLTLLTALDLPWVADGLMRDGEHVRAPVDALLRTALQDGDVAFSIVTGSGEHRLANAMRALQAALKPQPRGPSRWRPVCAECGDPDCERHLLRLS